MSEKGKVIIIIAAIILGVALLSAGGIAPAVLLHSQENWRQILGFRIVAQFGGLIIIILPAVYSKREFIPSCFLNRGMV